MNSFKTPSFFIKIIDGKLVLWDYRHHAQFEISIDYLKRILEISQGSPITDHEVDLEIKKVVYLA